jgi:hypothetical protein
VTVVETDKTIVTTELTTTVQKKQETPGKASTEEAPEKDVPKEPEVEAVPSMQEKA